MTTRLGLMFVARFLFGIQQWAIVTILARHGEVGAVGTLGYGLAVIVPLSGFFGFGMRQSIATDVEGRFSFSEYLQGRMALIAALIAVVFTLFFLLAEDPIMRQAALFLLLPKSFELMSEMAYGVFQRHGWLAAISFSLILRALVGVAGFWTGLYYGGDLQSAILGWGITWGLVFLSFDLPMMLRRRDELSDDRAHLKVASVRTIALMLVIQFPLAASALVGNLGVSAPRLVLDSRISLEALGVFTAISMLFQAGNTLAVAVLQLFMTPLAHAMKAPGINRILRLIGSATGLVIGGLVLMWSILWLFGAQVLALMYGTDYTQFHALLLLLAAGWSAVYLGIIFRYSLTAARVFWIGMGIDGTSAALITLACIWMISAMPAATMPAVAIGFAIGQWAKLVLTVSISVLVIRRRNVSPATPGDLT